jgi:8-hydroxy-5-deazaflavin:NADPH oxidoreductase
MKVKNIAIIGTGKMSRILSNYFATAGHRIWIGSRNPDKAIELASNIGHGVKGMEIDNAVQHGDIIFIAVPYLDISAVLKLTGPLKGKTVVDMSNPFKPDFSGLLVGGDTSAAEEIANAIPEAFVVKAFNTVFATVLERGPKYEGKCAQIFYAGDDDVAKKEVSELIGSTGFEAIDTGKLISARFLEPLSALLIQADNSLKSPAQITLAMLSRPQMV